MRWSRVKRITNKSIDLLVIEKDEFLKKNNISSYLINTVHDALQEEHTIFIYY